MLLPCIILVNIGGIYGSGMAAAMLAVIYAAALAAAGVGLIRFRGFSRYLASLIFLSFFVLPFLPGFEDDKASPLLFLAGAAGLYYLLRKTARKILAGPSTVTPDSEKRRKPFIRTALYAVLLILALVMLYTMHDVIQARRMAAEVCQQAQKGKSLEEFLSAVSRDDFKIIKRPSFAMIVSKRGMGRNNCTVYHDGEKITGIEVGIRRLGGS